MRTWSRRWPGSDADSLMPTEGAPQRGDAPLARASILPRKILRGDGIEFRLRSPISTGPYPAGQAGWAGIEDVKDIIADLEQALAGV